MPACILILVIRKTTPVRTIGFMWRFIWLEESSRYKRVMATVGDDKIMMDMRSFEHIIYHDNQRRSRTRSVIETSRRPPSGGIGAKAYEFYHLTILP